MADIEKRYTMNRGKLRGASYFQSILQEAHACGLLSGFEVENIQLQCISFLSDKCERYHMGESSSISVEAAASIMKSNLYTIGLYLKSLPDADCAVRELKTVKISALYERGRKLAQAKFREAKQLYHLVLRNRIATPNYSYNSTLSAGGIGIFFKSYNLDYEAHEAPASIDYQLCHPVDDLIGVEFMEKYLENLYLENEFCRNFDENRIHHLLYGFDPGYKDLLLNIFAQVLTAALGCSLAGRSVRGLTISRDDLLYLQKEFSKYDVATRRSKIQQSLGAVCAELNVKSLPLQKYAEKSLPGIAAMISRALETGTLDKVFVVPVNPGLKPSIHFAPAAKMDDADYRELIEELLRCRHSSDKLALIKEKVKSFDDLEDILLDAQLSAEEIAAVLGRLEDVELAEMISRHPYQTDVQAVDLSENEQALRLALKHYML